MSGPATAMPALASAAAGVAKAPMNMAIQIVLGLVFVVILYIVTLVVLNIDSMVVSAETRVKPREMTRIIDGFASVSYLTNKQYNTVTPFANMFKKISKSLNTAGGAQFSYQFWIKVEDANDELFKNLIVLLKGDKRKFRVGYYKGDKLYKKEETYAVSAPTIMFTNSFRDLRVIMNTSKAPIVNIDINMNASPGAGRQNLLSLMALNSWFMLTFVFVDSFSVPSSSENGIKFLMYVNDIPYIEHTANSMNILRGNTLKQNDGDLFIFPDNTRSGEFVKIGNVNYYNYALTPKEVTGIYGAGPPNHPAVVDEKNSKSPAFISAGNKIDIWNY